MLRSGMLRVLSSRGGIPLRNTMRRFCSKSNKKENDFFRNTPVSPGKRFGTSLIFGAVAFLGVGGMWAQGIAKYGSFQDTWDHFENELDAYYFWFNNPGLFRKFKLLPPPAGPHYTVVVDLKDLIYIRELDNGQKRPQMRPYMDVFLEELSQRCEVIIWSSIDDFHVMEWIEKLDKRSPCFHSVLYFTECTVKGGRVVKDLRRINRPAENIIHVCSSPALAAYQPDNALFIQGWFGDEADTSLLDLYVYLQYTVQHHNPATTNIREHLKTFRWKDPAESNRTTQERWKDQILENNKQTKASFALMKKEQGISSPLSTMLG